MNMTLTMVIMMNRGLTKLVRGSSRGGFVKIDSPK